MCPIRNQWVQTLEYAYDDFINNKYGTLRIESFSFADLLSYSCDFSIKTFYNSHNSSVQKTESMRTNIIYLAIVALTILSCNQSQINNQDWAWTDFKRPESINPLRLRITNSTVLSLRIPWHGSLTTLSILLLPFIMGR